MSNTFKNLNDTAWELLFDKYNILHKIDTQGLFVISSTQIKKYREPRLMAKFDHIINLPHIFTENRLVILPITRGNYVISHYDAYHFFEANNTEITKVSLPLYIESIDTSNIYSETIALNSAVASGIIADFLQDDDIVPTVSGRMGTGRFSYEIHNNKLDKTCYIGVNNSQIEIDAAYEGVHGLALFEAKRDLSDDFIIRQLYYPYRVWQSRVNKPVRTVFLIYSNGIYRLYEYIFQEINNYNSLTLVKQKNYTLGDTHITMSDIQAILRKTVIQPEPTIPFPQADNFERVINICELLNEQALSRNDITEQYAFDSRQTNYYTDAARYLGLLEKKKEGTIPTYTLTNKGISILSQNYKQRQIAFCECILSHKVFADVFHKYLISGNMPSNGDIINIMKQSNLYNIGSDSTFERRCSTIKGWLNWVLRLVNVA